MSSTITMSSAMTHGAMPRCEPLLTVTSGVGSGVSSGEGVASPLCTTPTVMVMGTVMRCTLVPLAIVASTTK